MLEQISAILIEDEPRSQKALELLIAQNCPQVDIKEVCNNAAQGIVAVAEYRPKLVFLDIRMPGLSGFEFLDAFDEPSFEIIFVTAYDQYAIQALRRSAVDYLLKPVDAPDLVRAVRAASKRMAKKDVNLPVNTLKENHKAGDVLLQKLAIPTRNGLEFISFGQVTKLQADRNYTNIFLADGKNLLSTYHLKTYEETLPQELFFRSHHSYIINLQHVKTYMRGEGGYVVLSDGGTADVSKRRKKDFLRVFGQ